MGKYFNDKPNDNQKKPKPTKKGKWRRRSERIGALASITAFLFSVGKLVKKIGKAGRNT